MTTDKTKKKVGRPKLDYTPELAEEICYAVSCSNKGIKQLCKKYAHWPSHDTIYRWLANHKDFSDSYARAKALQVQVLVDEILEIADDSAHDTIIDEDGNASINHEHINRSRLRIDSRKWIAAKLCPRLYDNKHERIALNFPQNINAKSLHSMSAEVFRALANQEVTPEHARTVLGTIKDYSTTIVIADLNEKLDRLLATTKGSP